MYRLEGYDTVHLKSQYFPATFDNLKCIEERKTEGGSYTKAHLQNLYVTMNQGGETIIRGSLATYFNSTSINYPALDPASVNECLEKLSQDLGIDFSDSIVKRVDYAVDLSMECPVSDYLGIFGRHPKMRQDIIGGSKYYKFKSTPEQLKAYDKGKQIQKKRKSIPIMLEAPNLMRCEISLTNPFVTFNKKIITASMLSEEETKQMIRNKAMTRFNQIHLDKPTRLNFDGVTTPADFILIMGAMGVKELGIDYVQKEAKGLQQRGQINKTQFKRIMDKAKELNVLPAVNDESDLIKEWSQKMGLPL